MARKITGLQRVLDAPALFSVAYGEIASSIYVALGIIALHALGLTPEVLAIVGALFLVVSLSYAEGTTSIPETGGAATFVRRAFNDLVGFLTGWALFLDYLIVIALSGLFLPHYLGAAMQWGSLEHNPWDVVVGVCVVFGVAAIRLVRRSAFYSYGIFVAVLDLLTQLLLVVLGFAFLFSSDALTQGVSIGTHPSWHQIAFALPLAMLAYTGLETVANLAEETREPGRDLPRSLFSGIGLVVLIYVAIALRRAERVPGRRTAPPRSAPSGCGSPLMGIVDALRGPLPDRAGDGAARLRRPDRRGDPARRRHDLDLRLHAARALARRARPAAARLRPAEPAHARLAAGDRRGRADLDRADDRDVVRARRHRLPREPLQLRRARRLHGRAARRDQAALQRARPAAPLPGAVEREACAASRCRVPAIVGSVATFAIWIAAMATHPGARYGGPAWLAAGAVVYLLVRKGRGEGLLQHVAGAAPGASRRASSPASSCR